jgi:carboxymethylenebutenolidase
MEITKGMVEVEGHDGKLPAFLARPASGGPHPGVVVVMEAFGLNDHIKGVGERIAAEGYAAVAPNLYHRAAGRQVVGYSELQEAIGLMSALHDDAIVKDMAATVGFLQKQPFVKAERIGVTGFCMGGRVTFLTACLNPAVKAAVPFYGGGIGSVMMASERTPKAPLEYADRLQAPLLLFFGENDPFIPLEEVDKIRKRLGELGKQAETIVYPGAPHGFFCDERDSYRADAAADAWQRLTKFFGKHLRS